MNKRQLLIKTSIAGAALLIGALGFTLARPYLPEAEAKAVAPSAHTNALAAPATALQAESAVPRTITVVGEGRVTMQPDLAQVNIGIEVVGETVKDAGGQASETMDAVIAALKAQGIAEKDIQTSGYSVWVERPYSEGLPTGTALYHFSNSVMVNIRSLDKVGTSLDAAIEAGANNIFGVTFSVAEPGQLMSEARRKAVSDALSKANQLAEMNQVKLGNVVTVSEVVGGGGGYYPGNFSRVSMAEGMGGGGGPISPGELEMTVQLQITYSIE